MISRQSAVAKSLRTNFSPTWRDHAGRLRLRARQAVHLPALLAGGSLERPIFIVGAPRSGTSLLFSILRVSPHLGHWPGEAHEVWEASHHPIVHGRESNVLEASDATPEVARRIRRSFFLVTGRSKRLIEKSPRNSLRLPFVDAIFPDAHYVYLKRDGRDNVSSLINAWRTTRYRTYRLPEGHAIPGVDPAWWKFILYPGWKDDLEGPLELVCARQWRAANEGVMRSVASIDESRHTSLRYEDLVERPAEEIGRLVARLGFPFDHEVRARAESAGLTPVNVVTPPERGKWRRENPKEIAALRPLIEPMMEEMGYGRYDDFG
ncbi:hypothetical protein BH18ACT15_BH18ACT15_03200 [soil metagenome]